MKIAKVSVILTVCCLATARAGDLGGLDDFVRQAMTATGTPGVAVAVVRGEQVILARGYGVREIGKSDPVDQDTVFAIGSNSKYFTATALGLLVEEGRLSWDAPLTRYLPQLRFSDSHLFTELTLRDALSHRTGLESGDLAWKLRPQLSRAEVLQKIEKLKLQMSFRSGYLYNNYMYVAAGELVPAVTGSDWDTFVKTRLLDPLAMRRSSTSVTALKNMPNVAMPHAKVNGQVKSFSYYDTHSVAAAGSINSSATDMAQWCKVQLSDGQLSGRQIIPKSIIDAVRTPHTLRPTVNQELSGNVHLAYALGINRLNFGAEHVMYSHGGSIDGMVSQFAFVPAAQVCAIVLTNLSPNHDVARAISTWIFGRLLGLNTKGAISAERFAEHLAEEKARKVKTDQRHLRAHDPSVKASAAPEILAGTYTDDLYGDLIVNRTNGELWVTWGNISRRLRHHRGDSFEFEHGQPTFNSALMVLNFAFDASGQVESVLLQHLIEQPLNIRFSRKRMSN